MDKEQIVAFIKTKIQILEYDLTQVSKSNAFLPHVIKAQILSLSQVLEQIETGEEMDDALMTMVSKDTLMPTKAQVAQLINLVNELSEKVKILENPWQPIESVPHGVDVLLIVAGETWMGRYSCAYGWLCNEDNPFDGWTEEQLDEEQFWLYGIDGVSRRKSFHSEDPTHWMGIPELEEA